MFDIVYSLIFDFIDMLKWYIPIFLCFLFIGHLIKAGGK